MIKVGSIVRHKMTGLYYKAAKLSKTVGTFVAIDDYGNQIMVERQVFRTDEDNMVPSIQIVRLCNCEAVT